MTIEAATTTPGLTADAGQTLGPRPIRAVDRLFAAYLAIGGLALLFPNGDARSRAAIGALHLLGIAVLLRLGPIRGGLRAIRAGRPRLAEFAHDWYPLALIPVAYRELPILNHAVWNGRFFDDIVRSFEAALLGPQPLHELSAHLPYLFVSELLNVGYLSYYLIIYAPPIALYALGRRDAFRSVVFGVILAFSAHYVIFIFFPVLGPFFVPTATQGLVAGGVVERTAHAILNRGAAMGATFPSSHVGVSVAQSVYMSRHFPALFWPTAVAAAAVAVGAVYGGYHYSIDVMMGGLYGALLAAAMPRLESLLG